MSRPEDVHSLIEQLERRTELGTRMFLYLISNNLLESRKIRFNPTISDSHALISSKTIIFGTAPLDKEGDEFTFGNLTEEDVKLLIFLHEMAHIFIQGTSKMESTQNILSRTKASREATAHREGLSAVGSDEYYPGETRPEEDTAELIAMRLRSAEYLGEFALFLTKTDPDSVTKRRERGLVHLDEQSAVELKEIVNKAIEPIYS